MGDHSNAFYVVRKGDIVGVYKSLNDCQAQVSSSVSDPSVRVYKGFSLQKETEDYLASQGLKNALYSIHASDVKEDLFGTLVPCPFQDAGGYSWMFDEQSKKHPKLEASIQAQPISSRYMTCILEFDGASKGNPGKAGAGAILRTADGSVVANLREGLGIATNNVAEYRALILGMKCALKKGFKQIQAQGDSKLVCMQVQGLWQCKNQNMADLCKEVKRLKQMFMSFKISHVLREFNSGADAQANLAVNLRAGEVSEDSGS